MTAVQARPTGLDAPTLGDGLEPVSLITHGRARAERSIVRWLAPLAVLATLLTAWSMASWHLLDRRQRFIWPAPLDVVRVGFLDGDHLRELLDGLWSTSRVALVGLAISMALGVALAVLMSQARWVERSIYPYAVVLQTIPILAVVPLLGYWFGFEFRSRVIVCVLVSLFPIMTNTLFGLQSVEPGLHDLFSLHGSSRWQRLRHLQLPAALPAIVAGFKISAGLSVIGAIIADFFFRQGNPGIGRLIDVYRQRLATEQLLSALVLSSLVGLGLFWAFSWLGRRVERGRSTRLS
jgi:NitT/TauT family transport system permease protein